MFVASGVWCTLIKFVFLFLEGARVEMIARISHGVDPFGFWMLVGKIVLYRIVLFMWHDVHDFTERLKFV